jgi:hypothetical protein
MMALWFAPALVMLHEVAPLDAMRLSARACFHNLLAFIVLAALLYVLVWVAMIPAGLGMLVLVPVIAGALYAAWKETFSPLLPAPAAASDHTPDDASAQEATGDTTPASPALLPPPSDNTTDDVGTKAAPPAPEPGPSPGPADEPPKP